MNETVNFSLNFSGDPKVLKETEDRVKGISQATAGAEKSIQHYFDVTKENITMQKQVIADLERQLKEFDQAIQNAAPGKLKRDLLQERASIANEINAEKSELIQLEAEVKKTEVSHDTLRTTLRKLQEEMARMVMAGKRNTDEYRELQLEAGRVADTIGDVKKQSRILANDERMFQGVIEGIGGIAGAFSAAQGAVGLFAGENENLQKIMTRVQSLMAITIGLQQIAQVVNKDSAFRVAVLTKAKEMWATTNIKVATSLGVTTAASRVLITTLSLGLVAAITAIIATVSVYNERTKEAKQKTEEFNKSIADAASKPIAALLKLSAEYKNLGDNLQKKEAFILKNQDAFEKLGISIQSVSAAENALVKNTNAVINALVIRAKAAGAANIAEKKAEEYALARAEMDATYGRARTIGSAGGADKPYKEAKAKAESLEKEMQYFQNLAIGFANESDRLLKKYSDSSEGSIDALKNKLNDLNKAYDVATTSTKRSEILKQIRQTEKEIEDLDKRKVSKKNDLSDYKDQITKNLEIYQSGIERIKFLKEEFTKTGSNNDKKSFISDLLDKEKENINKSIEDFTKSYYNYLDKKSESVITYLNNIQKIDDAIAIEPDVANKEFLTKMKETYIKMYELGIDGFDALNQLNEGSIADFGTFEEKKLQIVQKYEKQIAAARFAGNENRAKNLEAGRDQEITQLLEDTVKSADAIAKLFTGIDQLGDKAKSTMIKNLKFLIDWVDQNKNNPDAQWTGSFIIDPKVLEQLNATPEVLEAMKIAYQEFVKETDKPAFTKLMDAIEELQKARQQNNIEGATEASAKIAENIEGAAFELIAATDLFAGIMDAFGANSGLTRLVSQATSAYSTIRETGIDSLQSVSSIIGLAIAGIGLIYDEYFRELEKQIAGIEAHLQILQNSASQLKNLWSSTSFRPQNVSMPKEFYGQTIYVDVEVRTKKEAFDLYKQNLMAQIQSTQDEFLAYMDDEGDDADPGRIAEYENKLANLKAELAGADEAFANTFGEWSSVIDQVGDSIFEAFANGEDAATAFGDTMKKVFRSMVKDAFTTSIVAQYLQPVIDMMNADIGKYGGDVLLNENWWTKYMSLFQGAYDGMEKVLPYWQDFFDKLGVFDTTAANGLQTAIKSITSEEAGIIAGQFNAMRINGYELNELVMEALLYLSKIETNTSYIKKIYDKINSTGTNNRSQGLLL